MMRVAKYERIWKEGDLMQLYPHQIQVLKDTADKNRVAYFLDMGLG